MRLLKCLLCIAIVYALSPVNGLSERSVLDAAARAVIASQAISPAISPALSPAAQQAAALMGAAATVASSPRNGVERPTSSGQDTGLLAQLLTALWPASPGAAQAEKSVTGEKRPQ